MMCKFGLVWFGLGENNHLMRWIMKNLFVHWAKELNIKQAGLGSRSKSQMFLGKDRQALKILDDSFVKWFDQDKGKLIASVETVLIKGSLE